MKDRAIRYAPVILACALLLALALPAAAAASAPAPAAVKAAAQIAAAGTDRVLGGPPTPAMSKEVKVIDAAAAVIPNANHYKCYPITGFSTFNPQRVLLRDQFWHTWVWVWRPLYLCNPTYKTTVDGQTYAPPQWDAHLVCYEIREEVPTPDWEVRTLDQFGWLSLKGNAAQLLCLPAYKQVVVPPTPAG